MKPIPTGYVRALVRTLLSAAALALSVPASAAEPPLQVGAAKLASSASLFVAKEEGFFDQAGVPVDLKLFDAAQTIAVAVVSGDLDIGVGGLTAGFYSLAGKGALKIIGASTREEPGYKMNALVVSNKAFKEGLTGPEKLSGRSLAITQVGSTQHYVVGMLSEKYQFPMKSVRLIPVQSLSNISSTLRGNGADAAILGGSVAVPLAATNGGHIVAWLDAPWQVNVVFSGAKQLEQKRDALKRFMVGYRKGVQAYYDVFVSRTPPADAAARRERYLRAVSKYTSVPVADLAKLDMPYIDPNAHVLSADVARQVEWHKQQGLLDKNVDARQILNESF